MIEVEHLTKYYGPIAAIYALSFGPKKVRSGVNVQFVLKVTISSSCEINGVWERVAPKGEVPGSDFMSLAMHPQQYSRIFAGGHDLGILRSEDFGQSWKRSAQGVPSPDVHRCFCTTPRKGAFQKCVSRIAASAFL